MRLTRYWTKSSSNDHCLTGQDRNDKNLLFVGPLQQSANNGIDNYMSDSKNNRSRNVPKNKSNSLPLSILLRFRVNRVKLNIEYMHYM